MSRRFLRISLTVVLVLAFTGFFAFTTFLFNPFEGEYEYDIASLVPRDVDVYVSKADLIEDFDPFPTPRFADALLASESGQALANTVTYRNLMADLDFESLTAELDAQLEQLPIDVEVLELFGGKEVVCAAYLPSPSFDSAEWVVVGRVNWKAKAALAMLDYPGVIGLDAQGITATEIEGGGVTLTGGQITEPISLYRVFDVVMITNKPDFIERAKEFEGNRGQDSFLQSDRYADRIQFKGRKGDELELYAKWPLFSQAMGLPSQLLDPNSESFVTVLLSKLLATSAVSELAGTTTFDRGVAVRLHGRINSENLTPQQRRLHYQRGIGVERVMDLARMAPADTGLVAQLGVPLDDLLRLSMQSIDPATRQLIDDAARSVWAYPDAGPLIDDIDAALGNRVGLIVRDHDYKAKEGDPPHDATVVPAWCLVVSVEDRGKLDAILEKVARNGAQLGLAGNEQGSVFRNPNTATGVTVTEYWSPLMPGTGHLASLVMGGGGQGGTYLLVGNHYQIVSDCLQNYYAPELNSLEDDVAFSTMMNAGLGTASMHVYYDPRALQNLTTKLAAFWARETAVIDWQTQMPRIERNIVKEEYGEAMATRYPNDLPPEVRQRVDQLYPAAADAFESSFNTANTPELERQFKNTFKAAELVDPAVFQVLLKENEMRLYLRALLAEDAEG